MANKFVHIELNTSNTAAAREFYAKLFDWQLSDMPMGEGQVYTLLASGGTGIGGIGEKDPHNADQPNAWLPYVEVESVQKSIEQAKELGATIVVEYQPVGDMGALGIFLDPSGAPLGIWETAPRATPDAEVEAEAAAPAKKPRAKKAAKKPAKKAKAGGKKAPAKKAPAKKGAKKAPAKKAKKR